MYKKINIAVAGLCLLAVSACTEEEADPVFTSGTGGGGIGGAVGPTAGTIYTSGAPGGGSGGILPQASGGTGGADLAPVVGDAGNVTGFDAGLVGTGGSTAGISGGGGAEPGADSAAAEASIAEASVTDAAVGDAGTAGADGSGQPSQLRAVIVRAAEVPAGDPAAGHPDAITTATIQPYNTYVFTEVLAEKLTALGVTTELFHHYECAQLSCAAGADIVVLASPTYMFNMLAQVRDLVPHLSGIAPPPGVCSGLTSCGMSGNQFVNALVQEMSNLGMNTIPPVALQVTSGAVVTEDQMNTTLETFANALVAAVP
jgi:hypothetical protein